MVSWVFLRWHTPDGRLFQNSQSMTMRFYGDGHHESPNSAVQKGDHGKSCQLKAMDESMTGRALVFVHKLIWSAMFNASGLLRLTASELVVLGHSGRRIATRRCQYAPSVHNRGVRPCGLRWA